MSLESFIKAFRTNTSGCVRRCQCRIFYFNNEDTWAWEENELEGLIVLAKEGKAVCVEDSVRTICFNSKEYVIECSCWREEALKIIKFLNFNAQAIKIYFNEEKERKRVDFETSIIL